MLPRLLRAGLWSGFLVAAALSPGDSPAQPSVFTPSDEQVEALPPGPGREETFYACTACHGFKLVSNQGMSRDRWDETLTWMTQRHNMPDIEGADRDLILDYLEKNYPPRAPSRAGGWKNPFTDQ